MLSRVKVLFGNNERENGQYGVTVFNEIGFDAYCCAQDGEVLLKRIHEDAPDVVVMDVFLPRLDAIAVMQRAYMECKKVPKFIITTTTDNAYVKEQLLRNGAGYIMVLPFRYEILAERVKSLVSATIEPEHLVHTDTGIELEITNLLREIGVPASLKGYHYLRSAIFMTVKDINMLDAVTGLLYPTIAKSYRSTPSRVERAIRHAIDTAWTRGNKDALKHYFGYQVSALDRKPTNSEFIATIADHLILKYKQAN